MATQVFDVSALMDPTATPLQQQTAQNHVVSAGLRVAQGDVVVFATETFYGLAALPTDARAVERLATLKGRDKDKPVALIACDVAACRAVADMPEALWPLAQAYWPGPLTLLLPARTGLCHPVAVTDAMGLRVGVRVSSHPIACALARAAGGVITATSANLSGMPAVSCGGSLDTLLQRDADIVLDAGRLRGQAPSSVVGLCETGLQIVREGAICASDLQHVYARGARG